jgi:mannose-6-phosphate isomerase-like protein (cupin superfamily)
MSQTRDTANPAAAPPERRRESYASWLEQEGIPVHGGLFVQDAKQLELGPWARLGGRGAYIRLIGSEDQTGAYVAEVPPKGALEPEVHLFEAVVYILEGRGATEFWRTGEPKRVVEWQQDSMLVLPLSVWHRFINLSDQPARYLAITNAPLMINLFLSTEFVYGERFAFRDRYASEDTYFSAEPRPASLPYGEIVYQNNFIPNFKHIRVDHPPEGASRGEGFARRYLRLGGNRMLTFAAEYPVGTYTTAHWHEGGVQIYIAQGEGFTLMWPPEAGWRPWQDGKADKVARVDFQEGTVYSPPTGWWHQHFNTGSIPVRYIPTGTGLPQTRADGRAYVYTSVREEGGHQLDYDLEDPMVRKLFEEAVQAHRARR